MAIPMSGLQITISDLLPREHIGDEIKPIMPHPLVAWLTRALGRKVWPVCFVPGKRIEEARAWMMGGRVFMPTSMFAELRRSTSPFTGFGSLS